MRGNISMVHSYNRKRVKEEDIPKYGRAVGIGTLSIGLGAMIKFLLDALNHAAVSQYVFLIFVVIGVAVIFYAQFKYNKGIF